MVIGAVDEIAELFGSAGARDYLGEPVTVAAHLLQAGAIAAADGAPPALVAAALLHDVGHLRGADVAVTEVSGREANLGLSSMASGRAQWRSKPSWTDGR